MDRANPRSASSMAACVVTDQLIPLANVWPMVLLCDQAAGRIAVKSGKLKARPALAIPNVTVALSMALNTFL